MYVKYNSRFGGDVAQLGERLVRNEEVSGSIPLISTKLSFQRDWQYEMNLEGRVGLLVPW